MADADLDALVVGAGFAGLYALHRLRGLGLAVKSLEAGPGLGGTWYWNRYPGARCDIESLEYSYQFSEPLQQEWDWTERYASQPEILRYLNHVADRFDLHRHIERATRVEAAHFDESHHRWTVRIDGDRSITARWLVMATGCLSRPNKPRFAGLERFRGDIHHTGEWPHGSIDFAGQRVGVIGTGSSAVQSIPLIAREADHLYVFQRTPTYSVPAHNGPLDPDLVRKVKADYGGFRARSNAERGAAQFNLNEVSALAVDAEERRRVYDERWARGGLPFLGSFGDLILDRQANATAAEYVRARIRAIVKDPVVAERLCPTQTFACKRLCVDSGYYETFNRPNVTLVDIGADPIAEIAERGLRTRAAEYALDALVFATGFDAMTGSLFAIDIRGGDGTSLREAWGTGPRTYLGVSTAGFPNLFLVSGPGSPSVLSNMVASIEQHVDWISALIAHAGDAGCTRVEPSRQAQDAWVEHVNAVAGATLYPSCNSWYLGANVPGKPRLFMPYAGGFPAYRARCAEIASRGYEGFTLSRHGSVRSEVHA